MTDTSFRPRLLLASLSGVGDATWAQAGAPYADAAVLGGIALDAHSQAAARKLVARGRNEFLPPDPLAFLEAQLAACSSAPIRAGFNVRSATVEPIVAAAKRSQAVAGSFLEINAHCRQPELCAVGCGETLLRETDKLCRFVDAAEDTGIPVGVKLRAEVPGVNLVETACRLEDAGATYLHVDAMDSELVIADMSRALAHTDCFLVANNGVRGAATVGEYHAYGADAVSVGRPSDNPVVLERVRAAVDRYEWESHTVSSRRQR